MMTIYLHGSLRKFGARFDLHVKDAAEAVRALCSQLDGFRTALQNGHFKLRYGNQILSADGLEKTLREEGHKTLHVTPVIIGAGGGKSGGIIQTIVGVVLVVISVWFPPAGWSATAIGAMGSLGTGLALGGISQLLTKTPQASTAESKSLQSTAFSGIGNITSNGNPIPLIYGEILVGSLIISQGITSYSIQSGGSIGFTPAGKASTTPNWVKREEAYTKTGGVAGTAIEPTKRFRKLL